MSAASLRYYEGLGLISSASRESGGIRHFPDFVPRRLKAIRKLQDLGFTLREIHALMRFQGGRRAQCRRLKLRLAQKLREVRLELKRQISMKDKLSLAIRQCKIKDGVCQGPLARLLGLAD